MSRTHIETQLKREYIKSNQHHQLTPSSNKKGSRSLVTVSTTFMKDLHSAEVSPFPRWSRKSSEELWTQPHTKHTTKVCVHRDATRPFTRHPIKHNSRFGSTWAHDTRHRDWRTLMAQHEGVNGIQSAGCAHATCEAHPWWLTTRDCA